ncbi:MAG: quinol:electron acceptor oxidoreductase subunit ActD [Polyangiaceae bacterium]
MSEKKDKSTTKKTPVYGILAEYSDPAVLIEACKKVRDAGFKKWDTYTPFPVHGIDPAMGIKPTILPWLVLCAGLTGLATAITLQWWTNAHDYPWIVSGKPFWSIPANVPIMFELTVLLSALTTLGGMLALNKLPHPSHPLDLKERFERVTDDKFFLLIEASDPKYDADEVTALLAEDADLVEPLMDDDQTPAELPRGIIYGLVILTAAAIVPFALAAHARESHNRSPRIHIVPDMDWQTKYKAQRVNTFFDDRRADRPFVEGTVARGNLREDDHFYRGKSGDTWARTFPNQVEVSEATMKRGEQRFDIFCAPCHGLQGRGDGMVNKRAESIGAGVDGWVPPSDITDPNLMKQPVGQLFNSITHGVRNMPAYGPQIEPEDRWAIILYVRALQRTRNATTKDLTPSEIASLK